MATFFTPRLVFLHVPKTGRTWITAAAERAGLAVSLASPVAEASGGASWFV